MIDLAGYLPREEIYQSKRSRVFRATRISDSRPVIIKIHTNRHPEPWELRKFRREFEIYRILDFPGVIQAHALEPYGDRLALITEDFGAVSLSVFRKRFEWNEDIFLEIAGSLAEILGQIHHRHYIHKDIKTDNVLIHPETRAVKLIDFDIASPLLRESGEARGKFRGFEGTPPYMSPEQWSDRSLDYRSDFYSLGVTLYELCTGRTPFSFEENHLYRHAHIALVPPSPLDFRPEMNPAVAAILLKLMSKDPRDRYQSGFGLAADFAYVREQAGRAKDFEFSPGKNDFSEIFQIPDKLYGREKEIETLNQAYRKTEGEGAGFAVVQGGSGIGKSALVEQLKRQVLKSGASFITGKFDQYLRNVPYSSLVQAFQEMLTEILSESPENLEVWRERIGSALGPNGRVIVDVLPELALVIGEQPPVPELGPGESENRFNLVFNRFVSALCTADRPLVVFLDDLQWSDESSLKVLHNLLADSKIHGLFIFSFRDREVDRHHILSPFLEELDKTGRRVADIHLEPLGEDQVNHLVSDTLRIDPAGTAELAAFVRRKTGGTPFFVAEFLKALHALDLISFDPDAKGWRWDLNAIEQENISENVVELMSWNIGKLTSGAREILTLASCIGNQFDLRTLAIVSEEAPGEVALSLNQALQAGLLLPLNESYRYTQITAEASEHEELPEAQYRFLHDRVQQAAYGMLGDAERQQIHLRTGRLLLERLSPPELEEEVFAVAAHWNGGLALLSDDRDRWTAIELNQRAGRKARQATAYDGASNYFRTAVDLLPAEAWRADYERTLALVTDFADAETLNSRYDASEELVDQVLSHARTALDRVPAFEIRIRTSNARGRLADSLNSAREILHELKINLPARSRFSDVLAHLLRAKWAIRRRGGPESILAAPATEDPRVLAAMRILSNVGSTAYQSNFNLFGIIILTTIRLTYQFGFTRYSAYIVATYGVVQTGVFHDYDSGWRFGQIALALLEGPGARELKCRAMMVHYSFIHHWKSPLAECLPGHETGAAIGFETGDAEFAGYNLLFKGVNSLFSRGGLDELSIYFSRIHDRMAAFHEEQPSILIAVWGQCALNLRGQSEDPFTLTGRLMNEGATLEVLRETNFDTGLCFLYHARALIAFLMGDMDRCLENVILARKIENSIMAMSHLPHLILVDSLVRLRLHDAGSPAGSEHLNIVKRNQRRFKKWTAHAPFNQEHRYLLVEAERHRVLGKKNKAAELFRQAGDAVKRNGFLLDSVLVYERAADFFRAGGEDAAAESFRNDALAAARDWGCDILPVPPRDD